MSKDRFMFFRNIRDVINSAETPEEKMQVFDAICNYAFDGIEPEDKWLKMVVQSLKPTLDYKGVGAPRGNKNAQKTIKTIETITDNENNCEQLKQLQTIKQETETETETLTPVILPQDKSFGNISPLEGDKPTVDEIVDIEELIAEQKLEETKAKVKRFKKPTVDEIEEYCRTSGYQIDANRFYDHYESNGWKVGKNPMKDWRAAVRNWVRGQGSGVKRVDKPDLVQQNRANLWAFVQDSGVNI